MKKPLKILMLEDIPEDAYLIERALRRDGMELSTHRVDTREELIDGLQKFKPDIVLSDHGLPKFNSLEALMICKGHNANIPFILVTGAVSEEFAVNCLKQGADDYVLKTNLSRLSSSVINSLKQKQLEQEKIKSEKAIREQNLELIKLNKELDNFVYSISHDLRAPLKSVMGLINLAEIEKEPANTMEYLAMMRRSVVQLDNILKEIIDYSRNERLSVEPEKIDLAALIDDCFERLQYIEGYDKIVRDVQINKKTEFYSDRLRLMVILGNLISNAMKYSDRSKEKNVVTIQADLDSHLNILIGDNGIGIDNRYLPKIFNMFYRATEKSDGAGLGLYIVKEAVKRLNGEISVESEPGSGTKFFIKIPGLHGTPAADAAKQEYPDTDGAEPFT